MRLLLDTNVLLWWLSDMPRLGPQSSAALADTANEVFVSPASVWEIEIKRAANKLRAPDDVIEAVADEGFQALPVTLRHAHTAGRLPRHHNDPFDRLLIAQALDERLTLVSANSVFPRYLDALLMAND